MIQDLRQQLWGYILSLSCAFEAIYPFLPLTCVSVQSLGDCVTVEELAQEAAAGAALGSQTLHTFQSCLKN